MSKKDYAAFDAQIVELIRAGTNTMTSLDGKHLALMAPPLQDKDRYGNLTPVFRVIDRRLQSLRKSGKIRFNGKNWELV